MEMPKSIQRIYWLGEQILLGIKLQLLFLIGFLAGGIILGFFPALTATMKILLRRFSEPARDNPRQNQLNPLWHEYWTYYRHVFWQVNGISAMTVAVTAIVVLDFAVNRLYLKSAVIQFVLVVLSVLGLLFWIYLYPVYNRYQLTFWQYFRQTAIIALSNIRYSLATFAALSGATAIFTLFPALLTLAIVPLYLTPIVWFIYQACAHVEMKVNYAGGGDPQ